MKMVFLIVIPKTGIINRIAIFFKFILRAGEGQKEKGRENPKQALLTAQSLTWGLIPQTVRS